MKIVPPQKVSHNYTQKIHAAPEKVFPLLCPVLEAEWVKGWDPEIVYTDSGTAEQDCIFITKSNDVRSAWYISRYEPETLYVEMIKFTPGLLVTKLCIQLYENAGETDAEITYNYFAISNEGEKELGNFTEKYYESFMKEWESEMNSYLQR